MAEGERSARLVREIFLAGFMSGLPPENIAWATHRLARNMEDVHLEAGDVLYRQGDATVSHYFVVYGEIMLAAEGVPAWRLGERSLVGTMDLMLDRARTRNATATRPTHLLRMPGADWLDLLEDNFELMLRSVQGLAEGVHEVRAALGKMELPHAPRPECVPSSTQPLGLVERVILLRGVPLFQSSEVQALLDLASHAVEVDFSPGEILTGHGEPNDAMFLTVNGAVTATTAPTIPEETFGPGMLVYGSRAATSMDLGFEARATVPTRVLRLVREDYFDAMEEHFGLARSSMKALVSEREILSNEVALRAESAT